MAVVKITRIDNHDVQEWTIEWPNGFRTRVFGNMDAVAACVDRERCGVERYEEVRLDWIGAGGSTIRHSHALRGTLQRDL